MSNIHDYINLIPRNLMRENGAAFVSGRGSFGYEHPLMILGANPGGSVDDHPGWTVKYDTDTVLSFWPANYHGYIDGYRFQDGRRHTWQGGRRVKHLADSLGYDLREIPTMQLSFLRSAQINELPVKYAVAADRCWPVVERRIQDVNPKVIVVMGSEAGNYLRRKLGANDCVYSITEDNNRRWTSRLYRNAAGLQVAVLNHPARVDWTNPATDPTDLVRAALDA